MRIGLIFSYEDVKILKRQRLQAVAIPPACPVEEAKIAEVLGVEVFSLSDMIEKAEMSSLSRDCARFVRAALHGIKLPIEAEASQNDIYQYHLRKQYLFYTALTRYLDFVSQSGKKKITFIFPFPNTWRYESPMRPETDFLFNEFRTFGYISDGLIRSRGYSVEFVKKVPNYLQYLYDRVTLHLRYLIFQTYMFANLIKKIKNEKYVKKYELKNVGIVVRTDSEVVSARALVAMLKASGISTVIIRDELVASETTAQRLDALGFDYVSIGSALGWRALLSAYPIGTRKVKKYISELIAVNLSHAESFMGVSVDRWSCWLAERLFDFAILQRHFAANLSSMIRQQNITLLVTFSFVDQWGPVIRSAGAAAGIRTICIQNAAQDPEEYPKLEWSDHYCVESKYLKNRLIDLNYSEKRITATGLPHYTAGFTDQASLQCDTNKKAILLITQPIYHNYFIELIRLLSIFCVNNKYELHIKYHPRQSGNEYEEVIENISENCLVKVFHREGLEECFKDARICVSIVSTAILNSINNGIPTISFLPKSEKYLDLYYCSNDNLFVAGTFEELISILEKSTVDYETFWLDFICRRQNYIKNHLTVEPFEEIEKNIMHIICNHI